MYLSCGRIKKTDAAKLQDEYAKLVAGLQDATDDSIDEDAFMTNPRTSLSIFQTSEYVDDHDFQSSRTIF
jgi:hypothetical protein